MIVQDVYERIVQKILNNKENTIGNIPLEDDEELEHVVKNFMFLREYEILVACDWNFNMPTGYDVISILLKMSNMQYNFDKLLAIVHNLARSIIFGQLPTVDNQPFQAENFGVS